LHNFPIKTEKNKKAKFPFILISPRACGFLGNNFRILMMIQDIRIHYFAAKHVCEVQRQGMARQLKQTSTQTGEYEMFTHTQHIPVK